MLISLDLTEKDVLELEEIIKYLPRYNLIYKNLSFQAKKQILEAVIYGKIEPRWSLRFFEQNANAMDAERTLGNFVYKVKQILIWLQNIILKGTAIDTKKVEEETKNLLNDVVVQFAKDAREGKVPNLTGLEAKRQILMRYFNVTYNNLMKQISSFKESERYKQKFFLIRWIYGYLNMILEGFGYEVATNEKGETVRVYSSTGKRLHAFAIFIGTLLGVGFLLLFLMTKLPIVGKLFNFFLKILSAPLRIIWNALGFILRKLRVI